MMSGLDVTDPFRDPELMGIVSALSSRVDVERIIVCDP
jgi:hypothetical protein